MGWSQGCPLVKMDTQLYNYWYAILLFPLILHVTEICEIPFTQAITFVQFLPIIKEKGLGFTYQARSNRWGPRSPQ